MKQRTKAVNGRGIRRAASGIEGLDAILHGGLPQGRTTLVVGGPGSGKTILALQTLVNGARRSDEPGIFVAFEESSRRIAANAAPFGWDLPALQKRKLFFLDAQPGPDLMQSGSFDLHGLLAALKTRVQQTGARRIVFDSLDVVLSLLEDPVAERREVQRLHDWLQEQELTAILTGKAEKEESDAFREQRLGFIQFMVDCSMALNHKVVQAVSQRNLRVTKFRGSSFSENEWPFVIGDNGINVAWNPEEGARSSPAPKERVSSGVERLDTMLCGGYYRGASVLVTGSPGTAKSTLAGTFIQAACRRAERSLFVSFDSTPGELVRNLVSVNIRLAPFQKKGLLRVSSFHTGECSAEIQFAQMRKLASEHEARCVVIDPLSALAKQGNQLTVSSVVERLVDWAKRRHLTILCTSLLGEKAAETENTPLEISTIADTWIHLKYQVRAGERNRSLTIVKSRGTAHSNQVRELILTDSGVRLADVFTAGGEVLMGTLRWEKEQAMAIEEREAAAATEQRLANLEWAEAELDARLKSLRHELEGKRAERERLKAEEAKRRERLARHRSGVRSLRGADHLPLRKRSEPS